MVAYFLPGVRVFCQAECVKDANVVPLLKSGKTDVLNPSSYRGVSLNVVMSKVLEKMVQKQIADHFEVKKP